ncbi:MAG TPA: DUF2235 domain-containing protein [Pseudomonas sp.]
MKNTWNVTESFNKSGIPMLNVTARIGVFFDGTGNNRVNSQIGADCRAMADVNNRAHIRECKGRHDEPGSSYANDLSNIARLAELYQLQPKARNSGSGLTVYWPVYIGGVGTISGGRDSFWPGQTFGRGPTGVVAKVARCMEKIGARLKAFQQENPDCVMSGLEFDVFGFSRGAAAGRHFINEVLKGEKGTLEPALNQRNAQLGPQFSWSNNSVRIKFVGLFDTVAAIGGFKDLGSVRDATNRRVNLYLPPGSAEHVVHLVARDELRRNFALNSVIPHWHREIVLPGAHSDIGGGYHPQMQERVMLTRPRRCVVSCETPPESTSAWREAFEELQDMDATELIDPLDETASLSVVYEQRQFMGACNKLSIKSVIAWVCLQRQVFGHLSRVHLRVMHGLACAEGVPFKAIPATDAFNLTPELHGIARKLMAYAEDGIYTLDDQEERILRRRYIHRSAHWDSPIGVTGKLNDALFVHAPQHGGRVLHPNIQSPGYPQ